MVLREKNESGPKPMHLWQLLTRDRSLGFCQSIFAIEAWSYLVESFGNIKTNLGRTVTCYTFVFLW